MKKYVILVFLSLCVSIGAKAQLTISSPFDKAVYQRSSTGNGTITFAGQAPNVPCVPNSYVRYRILRISLTNGTTISTNTNWTNINA